MKVQEDQTPELQPPEVPVTSKYTVGLYGINTEPGNNAGVWSLLASQVTADSSAFPVVQVWNCYLVFELLPVHLCHLSIFHTVTPLCLERDV